jgi:hypothetical protein
MALPFLCQTRYRLDLPEIYHNIFFEKRNKYMINIFCNRGRH